MIRIVAGTAPTQLTQATHTAPEVLGAPAVDYAGLSGEVKAAVRQKLHAAQRGRCAYCEKRIEANSESSKIEHFHPQRLASELADGCLTQLGLTAQQMDRADVKWGNLLLCCRGWEGSPQAAQSCDTKKANIDICQAVFSPRHLAPGRPSGVGVSMTGVVRPLFWPESEESAQRAIEMVLNLNLQLFKDTRARIFRSYLQQFLELKTQDRGRTATAVLRANFAAKARARAEDGAPFASTLLSVASFIEFGASD